MFVGNHILHNITVLFLNDEKRNAKIATERRFRKMSQSFRDLSISPAVVRWSTRP